MVKKTGNMFITGPNVIKSVTGEEISFEDLGGGETHTKKSGVAHFLCEDDKDCLAKVKKLLSYLPQNNLSSPIKITSNDDPGRKNKSLYDIVPEDTQKPYDMRAVINEIVAYIVIV